MNEAKYHRLDFPIIILFYLAFSCIPFPLFIKNNLDVCIVQISVQILFLIGLLLYFYKHKFSFVFRINKKALFLLLPTFIICFSNYFVLLSGFTIKTNIKEIDTIILIVLQVFIVINEELIFRYFAFDYFKNKSPILRTLLSSILFAVVHLSRYLSTFNPFDLIVVVYSSGLGLLLGVFYESCESIVPGVHLHLIFNMFNDTIFTAVFSYTNDLGFVLINVAIALLAVIYLLVLFLINKGKILNYLQHQNCIKE